MNKHKPKQDHEQSVVERTAGIARGTFKGPPPTAKELREMAEQAIADDVWERMGGSEADSPERGAESTP
jgi:hypothetical protein